MAKIDEVIYEMESMLTGGNVSDTPRGKQLANIYTSLCRELNQELAKCAELFHSGAYAEACTLNFNSRPPLTARWKVLNFPKRAEWIALCTVFHWEIPPELDEETIRQLLDNQQEIVISSEADLIQPEENLILLPAEPTPEVTPVPAAEPAPEVTPVPAAEPAPATENSVKVKRSRLNILLILLLISVAVFHLSRLERDEHHPPPPKPVSYAVIRTPQAPEPAKNTFSEAPGQMNKAVVEMELPLKDAYKLYREFRKNKNSAVLFLSLPAIIADAQKVEVIPEKSWLDGSDIKNFITPAYRGVKIHALNHLNGKAEKDKFMTVAVENQNLIIDDSRIQTSPTRRHIREIKFISDKKICSWRSSFDREYDKFIPYGKINRNFEYEKSDDEKIFGVNVIIKELEALKNINVAVAQWNKAAADFKRNYPLWKIIADQDEVLKKAREYDRELKKLLAEKDEEMFDEMKRNFDNLYQELTRMSHQTALKMISDSNFSQSLTIRKLLDLLNDHLLEWKRIFPGRRDIPNSRTLWYRFRSEHNSCSRDIDNFNNNQKALKESAEKLNKILAITGDKVDPAKPEELKLDRMRTELLNKLNGDIKKYVLRQIEITDL